MLNDEGGPCAEGSPEFVVFAGVTRDANDDEVVPKPEDRDATPRPLVAAEPPP